MRKKNYFRVNGRCYCSIERTKKRSCFSPSFPNLDFWNRQQMVEILDGSGDKHDDKRTFIFGKRWMERCLPQLSYLCKDFIDLYRREVCRRSSSLGGIIRHCVDWLHSEAAPPLLSIINALGILSTLSLFVPKTLSISFWSKNSLNSVEEKSWCHNSKRQLLYFQPSSYFFPFRFSIQGGCFPFFPPPFFYIFS